MRRNGGCSLQGEAGGGVLGEGLEIPYGRATACKQAQATMPQLWNLIGAARPLQERLEAPVYDVLGVEGRPVPGAEQEGSREETRGGGSSTGSRS